MHRQPDWEDRLANYLDRVAEEPFKWGSHDCALFAAGAVRAMCGVDPAADFRGVYSDEAGARLALREHGAGTLIKTATHWFGARFNPCLAKRGDLVMKDKTSIGVCVGLHTFFVGEEQGRAGLVTIPTSQCAYAFAVPFEAL